MKEKGLQRFLGNKVLIKYINYVLIEKVISQKRNLTTWKPPIILDYHLCQTVETNVNVHQVMIYVKKEKKLRRTAYNERYNMLDLPI